MHSPKFLGLKAFINKDLSWPLLLAYRKTYRKCGFLLKFLLTVAVIIFKCLLNLWFMCIIVTKQMDFAQTRRWYVS